MTAAGGAAFQVRAELTAIQKHAALSMCLVLRSARPVFVGIFVANFVGERPVDKVSDKGNVS